MARVRAIYQAVADARQEQYPWAIASTLPGMTEERYVSHINLFAQAFLWGLEYAHTYPERAQAIIKDKFVGGDNDAKYVDLMASHILRLFEDPEPDIDFEQLAVIARDYGDEKVTPTGVRPVFDKDGHLSWEDTNGKQPFATYHEAYEEWDEV